MNAHRNTAPWALHSFRELGASISRRRCSTTTRGGRHSFLARGHGSNPYPLTPRARSASMVIGPVLPAIRAR
jgi:hypothetical protein